ncbi:hypothetical protein GCM10011491_10960 [Brucella endophytica]|uniref:Uncharacterized protein n=1 Tax=Brucella endophytica TaxID=1963359 RepID=A0A916S5J8_9HYPH|nr:hypothetical protein GCM10011491_10960 [Brucella endophytica]
MLAHYSPPEAEALAAVVDRQVEIFGNQIILGRHFRGAAPGKAAQDIIGQALMARSPVKILLRLPLCACQR